MFAPDVKKSYLKRYKHHTWLVIFFILFYLGYTWLIIFLFATPHFPDYPFLRARFGTIMWHSSDANGEFLGAYKDPQAQDHVYCYYPKAMSDSKTLLKRVNDIQGCQDFLGIVIFREAPWGSEREKYWWSREQHTKDCNGCNDL